jgi:hypothetical protein
LLRQLIRRDGENVKRSKDMKHMSISSIYDWDTRREWRRNILRQNEEMTQFSRTNDKWECIKLKHKNA